MLGIKKVHMLGISVTFTPLNNSKSFVNTAHINNTIQVFIIIL